MNSLEGVKLALWDLDGTIINSGPLFAEIVAEMSAIRDMPAFTQKQLHDNFHGSLTETLQALFAPKSDPELNDLQAEFLTIQDAHYLHPDTLVFDDATALAGRIHRLGITQVVVTNREHASRGLASPYHIIQNSRIAPFIDYILPGDEVPARKPNPAVIGGLAVSLEATGDEIVVIGDQKVDADLAANLGARAVLVSRSGKPIPHIAASHNNEHVSVVSSLQEAVY